MIYQLIAIFLLLHLASRLIRRKPSNLPIPSKHLSRHQKLSKEVFQHAHLGPRLLILYATEYGFAREVANKTAEHLSSHFTPRIVNVLHFRLVDLTREHFIILICSTTGDGAVPNEAADFRDALVAGDLVVPPHVKVAVLALGDRGYPHFCRAGRDFQRLLGKADVLLPRLDVDQEDWLLIEDWMANLMKAVEEAVDHGENQEDDYLPAAIEKYAHTLENRVEARYTRNQPFMATISSRKLLTHHMDIRDAKEVIRVEFDISGSNIEYTVGDAVGIIPKNNINHVTRLLQSLASNGDEPVTIDGQDPIPFETALQHNLDIRTVKPELIAELARNSTDQSERKLAEKILGYDPVETNGKGQGQTEFGKRYLSERELFDILSDFVSATIPIPKFITFLRPLCARYYSISSTPLKSPDMIAATVDVLRYSLLNVDREGVASTYLRDRCRDGEKVGLFIAKNPNFRLPKTADTPVVMIGPGTGIAPFVAFLEERVATGGSGANWLFFGCRYEAHDFLYKERLMDLVKDGALRLETAFSRDGEEKVYVQHRMQACADELWELIDGQGAHVYVCGDGGKMAADVDDKLCEIVQTCGDKSVEEARAFVAEMSNAKRYQRDVWLS